MIIVFHNDIQLLIASGLMAALSVLTRPNTAATLPTLLFASELNCAAVFLDIFKPTLDTLYLG